MVQLRSTKTLISGWFVVALVATGSAACGSAEVPIPPNPAGGAGGETSAAGGEGGDGGLAFTTSDGGAGGGMLGPCANVTCPADQHCEPDGDTGMCVNNDCTDLMCSATEECETTAGGGAICADISCSGDIDCPPARFCDGTICVDDVCVPGESSCNGLDLFECPSNGSGEVAKFSCGGAAYFTSTCTDDGMGHAFCDCEDDWDCPAFTRCEGRRCIGTGVAPTCFLEPEPFDQALPVPEITWGGTGIGAAGIDTERAVGSAFPDSAQVVQTAAVANLDDDNGDGVIDDRDTPEIIFTSFCGAYNTVHEYTTNGTLRAIHGGGPNKGGDYFAACGSAIWHEGDDPSSVSCTCSEGDLDSTASLAVGDLNYDGVPEIVAITEGNGANNGEVRIYDNTGMILATSATVDLRGANPAPSIANVDNTGNAEIVIGRIVFSVSDTLQFVDRWQGTLFSGNNSQGPSSCVANVAGDARLEIIGGTTAYRFPVAPAGALQQADCNGMEVGDEASWCTGVLPVLWDAVTVNGGGTQNDGFCAVADIWGADPLVAPGPANPPDGLPEVLVVSDGSVQVFDGATGILVNRTVTNIGGRGGPPNVDDFDGDGFPEVGTAGSTQYLMLDYQAPTASCPVWTAAAGSDLTENSTVNPARTVPSGACQVNADCGDVTQFACNTQTKACVCLHNSWRRGTEDDSSRVTGSSVFDFNGDGAAEVIYNDECRFRVYDGTNGHVWMREPSESRTRIEYPIVADVDNDGNAEIVFSTSNESGFCSENLDSQYNNGIEVWGDQNDFWVSARRIWSQHAYDVTQITEDGMPPVHPPESWGEYNGRRYNVYRSNPRNLGIAPDLVPIAMQISSPDATCGVLSTTIDITVQIANQGDVRAGAGVVVGFYGNWQGLGLNEPLYADQAMTPLIFTLPDAIGPGESIFVTVQYLAQNNSPMVLPDDVEVVVDDGVGNGVERECDETNNTLTEPVMAGDLDADLRVELGSPGTLPVCPTVPTTVFNDGAVAASNVVVRFYRGNPAQGGTALFDKVFAGPIQPGSSASANVQIPSFPQGAEILIYAVVDPDNAIEECNDGNNSDAASTAIQCGGIN